MRAADLRAITSCKSARVMLTFTPRFEGTNPFFGKKLSDVDADVFSLDEIIPVRELDMILNQTLRYLESFVSLV